MKTYEDIKRDLNVTDATIYNWVKTEVLPVLEDGDSFEDADYAEIIDDIKVKFKKLQSRVNRNQNNSNKFESALVSNDKTKILIRNLHTYIQKHECDLNQLLFFISVIILERNNLVDCKASREKIHITSDSKTFTKFLNTWKNQINNFKIKHYNLLSLFDFPDSELDFLGSIYESLRTVSDKSQFGAYFTPQLLTNDISISDNLKVLDPCAGTGSLLLSVLSKNHLPSKIYLYDVDELALNIAKVNFAIFFDNVKSIVNAQIVNALLCGNLKNGKFDYIITNPPYGAKLDQQEKDDLVNRFPKLKTHESFSIILFNSIKNLNKDGKLCFILPESILNVGMHLNIRKLIFQNNHQVKIKHFGKAFKGVMSNIIRLEIQKGPFDCSIFTNEGYISIDRKLVIENNWVPPKVTSIEDIDKLNKIFSNKTFSLEGKCNFGLGIVTGNNSQHLIRRKSSENLKQIYTGKELKKFKFEEPKHFIDFSPAKMQQVASIDKYMANKICYKFISDSISTAYDIEGRLVLNSINFFIVEDPKISSKALSAFLNSSIVNFIYQKLFYSTKVLKRHIEMIPIPNSFYQEMDTLEKLYDRILTDESLKMELDRLCMNMFGLNSE